MIDNAEQGKHMNECRTVNLSFFAKLLEKHY